MCRKLGQEKILLPVKPNSPCSRLEDDVSLRLRIRYRILIEDIEDFCKQVKYRLATARLKDGNIEFILSKITQFNKEIEQ